MTQAMGREKTMLFGVADGIDLLIYLLIAIKADDMVEKLIGC